MRMLLAAVALACLCGCTGTTAKICGASPAIDAAVAVAPTVVKVSAKDKARLVAASAVLDGLCVAAQPK